MIRTVRETDLEAVTAIEAACFPAAEAAPRQAMKDRIAAYPDHFWVMEKEGEIIGFINGFVTDEADLADWMYEEADKHKENGKWQMIFGLDTLPSCQRQGIAAQMMQHCIEQARAQKRQGLVLTCKDHLVHYYAKFGFLDEGISGSEHGGVSWHQMRLRF